MPSPSPSPTFSLSSSSPKIRRAFCGYCGTPLSSWNERTRDEAEHINVTLGSLIDDDLGVLEELDLLEGGSGASTSENDDYDDGAEEQKNLNKSSSLQPRKRYDASDDNAMIIRGAPWFEDLVENSKLGTLRRRKGGHVSNDGSVTIEWEVTEWESGGGGDGDDDDDEETTGGEVQGTGKRKFKGDVDADVSMRNA